MKEIDKDFLEYEYDKKKRSILDIAKELGVSNVTIANNLRRYGIRIRNNGEHNKKVLNDNYIIGEYNKGRSSTDIGKELKVSYNIIIRILKNRGVDIRLQKNIVNHDFFNCWSKDMAYCLGFITADGNISKSKPYITIELKRTDRSILEYIKNCIAPTNNIYEYERYDKRSKKTYHSCLLSIYSKKIKNDLKKYDVYPNKTGTHSLNFDIPQEYFWHYVRGYFDADGSVWINSGSKRVSSNIVCKSEKFLIKLKKIADDIGSIKKVLNKKNGKVYTLYIWRMFYKDTIYLRDQIYKDYTFCLQRKKDIMYTDLFIPSSRWWTTEQIEYLKNKYIKSNKESKLDISIFTGKSIAAIERKAYDLGLTK